MARKYAEGTRVSHQKTRMEIEDLLRLHTATTVGFMIGPAVATVVFEMLGRKIAFRLDLPCAEDREYTHTVVRGRSKARPKAQAAAAFNQAYRQRWRALLLAVKAKLVSVAEGVESFDEAFLSHIVLPEGRTVGEVMTPHIAKSAYHAPQLAHQ